MSFPKHLKEHLKKRIIDQSLRELKLNTNGIDFTSNDYLALAESKELKLKIRKHFESNDSLGAKASRLLSGNHIYYQETERYLRAFHNSEACLIFNSGYVANLALLSAIPQKNDLIIYDQLIHASIRDGIRLSNAKGLSFYHNDLSDLKKKLQFAARSKYVIVESVYSMDGDLAPLKELVEVCEEYDAYLIVDEAHATGVIGEEGKGLVNTLSLEEGVFARIHTFGKAIGAHGAAIFGTKELVDYLVNYARPLIYSTALPPSTLQHIKLAYEEMERGIQIQKLMSNVHFFREQIQLLGLKNYFLESETAIQSMIISGNEKVKRIASKICSKGYLVMPILSPTVQEGKERIRICIHADHKKESISDLLLSLKKEV